MTATTVDRAPRARVLADPVPLSRLTAVELRKMFDTRSGFWLMASIVISALIATIALIVFAPDDELTYASFGKAIAYPMLVNRGLGWLTVHPGCPAEQQEPVARGWRVRPEPDDPPASTVQLHPDNDR